MDFLDFQTFSVTDNNAITENDSLPTPVQRLNLSSTDNEKDKQTNTGGNIFKLPNILRAIDSSLENKSNVDSKKDSGSGLSEKMKTYVNLSIDQLNDKNNNTNVSDESPLVSPLKSTPKTTSNRSNNSIDLNKLLSDNKNKSETTNIVLSKKLSNVLNNYNLNNYQATVKLRKALNLLENDEDNINNNEVSNTSSNRTISNNHKVFLEVDKLVAPDYIGTLTRKSLKNDIETELLKEHITVLEEFRPIVRKIKRLSSSIENIKTISDSLLLKKSTKINSAEVGFSLANDVEKLRIEMESLKLRKRVLTHIKDKFTLNQVDDDYILNGQIDDEFFRIVNNVDLIKESATYLLMLPESNAGNSLISKINTTQETINRKIFNHLLDFLYSYDTNATTNAESLFIFQRCLAYLCKDLTYFNEFIKRVVAERSKLILDEFLSQFDLNISDKKPIILNAHDPIRYIGDVLASIYSLIANEADFIRILFSFKDSNDIETNELSEDFLENLDSTLLNDIVQSLANSCKIRVEQVVRFEESFEINFEIAQLLKLYNMMFERKNIKKENALIVNLNNLILISNEKILESFTNFVKDHSETLLNYKNDSDLLAPDWLSEYLNKLARFFELYEKNSNVTNSGGEHDTKDKNIYDSITDEFIIKTIEEPLLQGLIKQLQAAFPSYKKNEQVKMSFLTAELNCFDLIKTRLQIFSNTIFNRTEKCTEILSEIKETLNVSLNKMKELQIKFLFEKTGLGLYNNLLNMIFPVEQVKDELDYDMYFSLNDNDLMNLSTINSNVHEKLNEYLPQTLTDVQETLLFKLTSPTIADEICDICFDKLSTFYSVFRKVLVHIKSEEEEEEVYNILNFSEQEFKMLLGIEEEDIE